MGPRPSQRTCSRLRQSESGHMKSEALGFFSREWGPGSSVGSQRLSGNMSLGKVYS